ncbi:ClbS/DfsB family four-helix bundle protein [Saccharibacillus alkalitolerans]|uniref:ClbS/DfsB family four-helix bundle protein n=1 Tax=Saccharibacillus alkalitolerans TaxID=2705290 RepID=A0ABX0FAN6_9BACL|nr:ClbS/DfsB family four-helix bundle protein [Saccharibacillus alkalitolerans]NGZ77992.1 ClbS/DfsB family four-helix bundle protein [Saccharibacillus alkalitolerans]
MPSYQYASKQELKDAIHAAYLKLDAEFDGIAEADRDLRLPDADRTPAEILAYQLGWLALVQGWDAEEAAGGTPEMPAPGYKWNRLGEMYEDFYRQHEAYSLTELRAMLAAAEAKWLDWIEGLSEEELFVQGARRWTGDKPNWPMARWIHINSAAPFGTFRGKIRKWKKARKAAE